MDELFSTWVVIIRNHLVFVPLQWWSLSINIGFFLIRKMNIDRRKDRIYIVFLISNKSACFLISISNAMGEDNKTEWRIHA